VELKQEKGCHDILTIKFKRPSAFWFEVLKTGTPVIFTWNQNGSVNSWFGYVNVVSKQSASQIEQEFKVVCVGTSYVLKAKSQRVFKNSTVVEAAEKIAKEFKFKFVGSPTSRRFDTLSLTGQSYWEWLQQQASRIGYVCLVKNGVMYFTTADKLIDMFISNSAVLQAEPNATPSDTKLLDRTLDSFTVLNSDYLDHDLLPQRTARVTSGVNPVTGQVFGSKSAPNTHGKAFREKETPVLLDAYSAEVVHSSTSAKHAAYEEARAVQFSTVAQVIGQGDPRIQPYSTVLVKGTGSETDGYWVTASVTHTFFYTGQYSIEGKVLSDGLGKTIGTSIRRPDGNPYGTVNLTTAALSSLRLKSNTPPVMRLISRAIILVESQQGFSQLGTIWSGR
jgi:phage protein D